MLIKCLLTELLAGVRTGIENVAWERTRGRVATGETQGTIGKYAA